MYARELNMELSAFWIYANDVAANLNGEQQPEYDTGEDDNSMPI